MGLVGHRQVYNIHIEMYPIILVFLKCHYAESQSFRSYIRLGVCSRAFCVATRHYSMGSLLRAWVWCEDGQRGRKTRRRRLLNQFRNLCCIRKDWLLKCFIVFTINSLYAHAFILDGMNRKTNFRRTKNMMYAHWLRRA